MRARRDRPRRRFTSLAPRNVPPATISRYPSLLVAGANGCARARAHSRASPRWWRVFLSFLILVLLLSLPLSFHGLFRWTTSICNKKDARAGNTIASSQVQGTGHKMGTKIVDRSETCVTSLYLEMERTILTSAAKFYIFSPLFNDKRVAINVIDFNPATHEPVLSAN